MASLAAPPARRSRSFALAAGLVVLVAAAVWGLLIRDNSTASRATTVGAVTTVPVGKLPDPVASAFGAVLRRAGSRGPVTVQYVPTRLLQADDAYGFPGVGGADRPVYVVVAKGAFELPVSGPCEFVPPETPDGVGHCADTGPALGNQLLAIIDLDGNVSSAGAGGGTDPFAKLGTPSTATVDAG